jgi:hypothetical protein
VSAVLHIPLFLNGAERTYVPEQPPVIVNEEQAAAFQNDLSHESEAFVFEERQEDAEKIGGTKSGAKKVDAKKLRSQWQEPDRVIMPQSAAERYETQRRINEREQRIDKAELAKWKKTMRERMIRGEAVTFADLYFPLEELNGVQKERVEQAKAVANRMAEGYAAQLMTEGMTPPFIERVVLDMFGEAGNYEWSQGSVTEYFLTKKRNCKSVAYAELIVFEKLIARLHPSVQPAYGLGIRRIKQHVIATLQQSDIPNRRVLLTTFLEPPVKSVPGYAQEAGTADVQANVIKSALVSDIPVTVHAQRPLNGAKVPDSPDIAVNVNDPVSDNLLINGDLKGSDYVMHQAEIRGVRTMTRSDYNRWFVPVVSKDTLEIWNGDPGVVEATQRLQSVNDGNRMHLKHDIVAYDFLDPEPKTIGALDWGPAAPLLVRAIRFGDVSRWKPEAVDAALGLKTLDLSFQLRGDGKLSPNIIAGIEKRSDYKRSGMGDFFFGWNVLRFERTLTTGEQIVPGDLDRVIRLIQRNYRVNSYSSFQRHVHVRFDGEITLEHVRVLNGTGEGVVIHLAQLPKSAPVREALAAAQDINVLVTAIGEHEVKALLSNKRNVFPDLEVIKTGELQQLQTLLRSLGPPPSKRIKYLLEYVDDEMDLRSRRAYTTRSNGWDVFVAGGDLEQYRIEEAERQQRWREQAQADAKRREAEQRAKNAQHNPGPR